MCGGYHQLLAYYYMGREIRFPEALVDTTLALQHEDGGFSPRGGGGACEDVDAVDILVNLYKRHDYKRPEIRLSLRRALELIKLQQMPDGGFVYHRDEEFTHMGMELTRTPANQSNMFATWFRLHTIALIAEVLLSGGAERAGWTFNRSISMGWHDSTIVGFPTGNKFLTRAQEAHAAGLKGIIKGIIGFDNLKMYWAAKRRIEKFIKY
jgi:hypothetical protein